MLELKLKLSQFNFYKLYILKNKDNHIQSLILSCFELILCLFKKLNIYIGNLMGRFIELEEKIIRQCKELNILNTVSDLEKLSFFLPTLM